MAVRWEDMRAEEEYVQHPIQLEEAMGNAEIAAYLNAGKERDFDVCANCGKPYGDHLLWDGNKCSQGSVNGWFPKSVADRLGTMKSKMFK